MRNLELHLIHAKKKQAHLDVYIFKFAIKLQTKMHLKFI